MMSTIISNLIRFILLVGVQVLVLDHIDLYDGLIVPYIYVLFILMLPIELERSLVMIIGMVTGMVMDLFSNTPGMHTSACVLLAFVRPFVLSRLEPRDGYEFGMLPKLQQMGLAWFLSYVGALVLIHHLWLFFAEILTVQRFLQTITRIFLSSLFTLGLCVLAQFLSLNPRKN